MHVAPRLIGSLVTLVLASACAHPPAARPAPVSAPATRPVVCAVGEADAALGERSAADIVAQLGTGADPYRTQDGVWLPHAPVLVNEDFDFATALSLGAVGAGLAAGQRKQHNEARAHELEQTRLPSEIASELEALRACGVHRWAVLWGGAKPELLVITDQFDAQKHLVHTEVRAHPPEAVGRAEAWH